MIYFRNTSLLTEYLINLRLLKYEFYNIYFKSKNKLKAEKLLDCNLNKKYLMRFSIKKIMK